MHKLWGGGGAVNVNRKEYLENVVVVRIVTLEWIFQKLVVNLLTEQY
jgi:hypothetical protein